MRALRIIWKRTGILGAVDDGFVEDPGGDHRTEPRVHCAGHSGDLAADAWEALAAPRPVVVAAAAALVVRPEYNPFQIQTDIPVP